MVRCAWREVLSHDDEGIVIAGDVNELAESFARGAEVKVAIRGLCDDLDSDEGPPIKHEVFIHLGACYYYTEARLFMASANPVVRTRPSIPLSYGSRQWDFGWLMPRTDGHLACWLCDPYTLKFEKSTARKSMRWFVSK